MAEIAFTRFQLQAGRGRTAARHWGKIVAADRPSFPLYLPNTSQHPYYYQGRPRSNKTEAPDGTPDVRVPGDATQGRCRCRDRDQYAVAHPDENPAGAMSGLRPMARVASGRCISSGTGAKQDIRRLRRLTKPRALRR